MLYTTGNGIKLELRKVHRSILDRFSLAYPLPEPVLKTTTIWGGVEQSVIDYNDRGYLEAMMIRNTAMIIGEFKLFSGYMSVIGDWECDASFKELCECGVCECSERDYISFVALDGHRYNEVAQEIMYISTVTDKGIRKAMELFSITWRGAPLENWGLPDSHARYGNRVVEDRSAAVYANMSWPEFCDMSGQEQSDVVAHYRAMNTLAYLRQKDGG